MAPPLLTGRVMLVPAIKNRAAPPECVQPLLSGGSRDVYVAEYAPVIPYIAEGKGLLIMKTCAVPVAEEQY